MGTLAVGALIGGAVGGVISAFAQYDATGEVDGVKVFTAFLAGAGSGFLAATGVGLVGQIAGNAGLSLLNNAADQAIDMQNNKQDEFDLFSFAISGAVGGIAGRVAGAGIGSNAANSLSNAVIRRISNAVNYQIGKGATAEISKALSYYFKSSATLIWRELLKGIIKSAGVSTADKIIEGSGLKSKAISQVRDYVNSL